MKRILSSILIIVFLFQYNLFSQQVIKGVVFNSDKNDPVVSANIYIIHRTLGTITDDDGYFSLQIPDTLSSGLFLVVDHVAYDTLQMSIANPQNPNRNCSRSTG